MSRLIGGYLLCGLVILSACRGATPPPTRQALTATPAATPTSVMPPTSEPTPPGEAESPTPLPTVAPPSPTQAEANPDLNFAQVIFVRASQNSDGLWKFDTTVRHNDEGWDHYADAWQVVDPTTNQVIAERILTHPHDTEQPFTRSQSNIAIPPALTQVIVRAKCNVHGFGGQEVVVDLTLPQGENFEVNSKQ